MSASNDEDMARLLAASDAMLREMAGFPIPRERLEDAGPLIAEIIEAIRTMDEADVDGVEPATMFRPSR